MRLTAFGLCSLANHTLHGKGLVYPRTQALGIEEYNYRTQRLDDTH